MKLLHATGVEMAFGDKAILRGCDLTVTEGERVGLVGINGAGKSTLLRIVVGEIKPDFGEVRHVGEGPTGGVGWLSQDPELPAGTVVEALGAAIQWHRDLLAAYEAAMAQGDERLATELQDCIEQHGWDLEHRVELVAGRLRCPPHDRDCATLSGGERRRVALARTLLSAPRLLVLDEPTNHLDAETIEWLQGFLEGWRGAVLLVTHDRYLLEALTTRIVEVEDGLTHSYPGSYADYLLARAERQSRLEKVESSRLNMIRREAAWASRSPAARSTKQRARLQRLDQLKTVRPLRTQDAFSLSFSPPVEKGSTLFEAFGLTMTLGEKKLFHDVALVLRPGDRLGILGPNGCGKSTLLKVVIGSLAADGGEIRRGPRLRIAMLDQARTGLDADDTVFEAAGGGAAYVAIGDQHVHVASFLDRLQFSRGAQEQPVSTLSGGERARLLLARVLLEGSSLLLLDEPTNDLDLLTLRVLEEAMLDFQGAALIVSHDRAFLDRVCTRVISFEPDVKPGEVTAYASRLQAQEARIGRRVQAERAAKRAGRAGKIAKKAPAQRKGRSWKENKEFQELPAMIEGLEAEQESVAVALSDPDLYKGEPGPLATLQQRASAIPDEIEVAFTRWAELEAVGEG